MKNVFFIGGIHGVGKGTICKKIIDNHELFHITASEVLKWEEISTLENKLVQDFKFTQNRLITNLSKMIDETKNYLLDGHYCLLNSINKPERINKETFAELNPRVFIIVIDEIGKIKSRLELRDNKEYDFNILQEFQNMEFEYAKSLSTELKIPLVVLTNGDTLNLTKFLKNESIT
jgi:adenylate kinase